MISLKRDTKKKLVVASGRRKKQSSIYKPNQNNDFEISRSKFGDFLTCPKCFYLDRVKGLAVPDTPGWTLNETTDILLKREFDICRKEQKPHRIFTKNNLNHIVPFFHSDLNKWRDALHYGLKARFNKSNIILRGGIDDVCQNIKTKELVIIDFKSQASNVSVEPISYFESPYHESYKTQLDFYAYVFQAMGFKMSPTAYLLVVNAKRNEERFNGKIIFTETLLPYKWKIDWIPNQVQKMINTMNSESIPESHKSCMNCAYANQYTLAVKK